MLEHFSTYSSSFLSIAMIYFIACVSPGPDMAITVRNTLVYSRRMGIMSALGITTGMAMHLTYTLLGIGYLVHEFPWVQDALKYVGAAWLLYIGINSLKTKVSVTEHLNPGRQPKSSITSFQAFRLGFFTNALNPFVILLFISILSAEIDPTTPGWIKWLFGSLIVSIAFAWFSFLALCFSLKPIKNFFVRLGPWLDRITGGLLIGFGFRLAFVASK